MMMESPMQKLMKLFKNESGATAIEYGLIAALIAVAIISAVTTLGTNTPLLRSTKSLTLSKLALC
jgi:pilus assembly protein Flp/PilA